MGNRALDQLNSRIHQIEGSQEEKAKVLGVSQSQLSRVLSGHRHVGLELAFAIEERLGIPSKSWRRKKPKPPRKQQKTGSNTGSNS